MYTEITLLSPLVKLLPETRTEKDMELGEEIHTLLQDDRFSFILNFHNNGNDIEEYAITLHSQMDARIEEVEYVPVYLPHKAPHDENYISHDMGLYPDLLIDYDGFIRIMPGTNRSCWITVSSGNLSGRQNLVLEIEGDDFHDTRTLEFDILDIPLSTSVPEHTEWFHQDSLLYYYNEKAWSERHWETIEAYAAFASERCGINTLLTPIFTPPIDTAIGKERTTVQLVDIFLEDGNYSFDFSRLERWCSIMKRHEIRNLELPHFFTQWGATSTPKIMVTENGKTERRFGWDVPAESQDYKALLESLIPATLDKLTTLGYDRKHVILHVSDEPRKEHLENYGKVSSLIERLAGGARVIDALSNVEYYESELVKIPVVSDNHLLPFLEKRRGELWTYYCVSQGKDVPNRFISMPSIRNRIMGTLLWYYDISGFLHWGYNFYLSQFSRRFVNPYLITDSYRAFTAGDPYLVYPGQDGKPLSSIRNEVQMDAICDYRKLKTLENMIGRERTKALVDDAFGYSPTFEHYPLENEVLEKLYRTITEKMRMMK